jgi:hypothetical protein
MNAIKMAIAAPLLLLAACAEHAERPRHVVETTVPPARIYLPALSEPASGTVRVTFRRGPRSGDAESWCNVSFDGQLYAALGRDEKVSAWLAPGPHVFQVAATGNPQLVFAPQSTEANLVPGEPFTLHVEWTTNGPQLQPPQH